MRGAPLSIGLVCLACTSSAFAQSPLRTLEDDLDSEHPPPGAELPGVQDPTADELEPPPLLPDGDTAVPELREDEIAIGQDELAPAGVALGVLLGWGFSNQVPNPWAFAVGVHGDYTADNNMHLGARFIYFLGEQTSNIFDFGLEGGYSFGLGPMRFIPTLGVGIAFLTVGSESQPQLYLAPGAYLRVDMDGFYFGVDVRGQFVFADPVRMGVMPMATIGLRY